MQNLKQRPNNEYLVAGTEEEEAPEVQAFQAPKNPLQQENVHLQSQTTTARNPDLVNLTPSHSLCSIPIPHDQSLG